MTYSRLATVQLILCLLWGHLHLAQANAPTVEAGETGEVPDIPLPDEGPRLEGHAEGVEALAFQEGLNAYRREAWSQARRFFEKVTTPQPPSLLAPSGLAFLAEATIRENGSNTNRLEGINLYKTLLRDYPASANAHRAMWRMGDVYLEQGWYQEAHSMYARALAAESKTADGQRALLGSGYASLGLGRWADAVQAFQDLRKLATQDPIHIAATVGLAHAFYRQHRPADARAMFHTAYRRWPRAFRLDRRALQRFAEIEMGLRHAALGRELLLLFYNLAPSHPDAPGALLRVADSLASEDRRHSADVLYDLIATHHAATEAGTLARMRLMVSVWERGAQSGDGPGGVTPSDLLLQGSGRPVSDSELETRLNEIISQHDQDAVGSEARFHLARQFEQRQDVARALVLYKDLTALAEQNPRNPWAMKASARLADILHPWIEAALKSHDDLTMVSLFQRHGQRGEYQYLGSPTLLAVAHAHRRLGFIQEAGRLFQAVAAANKQPALTEEALLSLSDIYLEQDDAPAARRVLERARLQFPDGPHHREVLHQLMRTMTRAEDWEGMLHFCRYWLLRNARDRDRSAMYAYMASAYLRLNQPDAARIAYEEAFKAGAPKTPGALLAYADTLAKLDQHAKANEIYATVLDVADSADQRDWAKLQLIRGWRAMKQYDRAQVALAELGQSEDELVAKFAGTLNGAIRQLRDEGKGARL